MTSGPLSTQGVDNALNLSEDPLFQGFDQQAGQSWIYPTNYPVRDYQFNIIQEALHKNTLVSLPTGLGKTFIAAVVMYNYFRWYPHGKLIFMAPTRPLVKQQVDACYSIMAFPKETTAELTGTTAQSSRSDIWKEKRVFFVTPQVLQNDLATIVELGPKIKCLVFDEAHRAKGNHAYCEVIRRLTAQTAGLFRVLALSATPGNSVPDILEVVKNLKISHLEFRTEESDDVRNYVFQRSLETIVVPLGKKLEQVRDDYLQILEVYTRTLLNYKVIHGNCATLTKGKIFITMREYQKKNQGKSTPNYSEIMKTLNVCVTLYHAYEVLVRHGLRGFLNFFEEHIDKPLLRGNRNLLTIMQDIREYLGPAPNIEALPDGTFTDLSKDTKFGHPKYYQLRDVLNQHFSSHSRGNNSTRVIVFFEYRESVMEAYALLLQSRPAIRPRIFLGQGSGITQKIQLNVVKAFREGTCNTLLSTCIGEEGLDVGQVDLIVCFDISNKSPIRMIQRMGRTGRQKEGRVIVLVTEGKEQQTLKECIVYKNNLGTFVLNSRELRENLGEIESPRMIPPHIAPKCEKMFMTVEKPALPRKNCNLKDLLRNLSHDSPKFVPDDDVEIVEIQERIRGPQQFWNRADPLGGVEEAEQDLSFSKNLERQRALQATGQVKHTKHSEMLVSLLQFADSKRFNIPVTQLNSNFLGSQQGKSLKQGDIRNMFSNLNTVNSNSNVLANIEDFKIPETLQAISDSNSSYPSELFTEISNFLSIKLEIQKKCLFCTNFQCPKDFICFSYTSTKFSIDVAQEKQWIVPDLDILNQITAEDFDNFTRNLMNPVTKLDEDDLNNVFGESLIISDVEFSKIENDFELEKSTEIQRICQESFKYETPKSFSKILSRFSVTSQDIPRDAAETGLGAVSRNLGIFDDPETSKNDSKIAQRKSEFSGIVTDDSTIELSKKQGIQKCDSLTKPSASLELVRYLQEPQSSQEILDFFQLNRVSDLFESENKTCKKSDIMTDLDRTVLYNTVTGPEKFESSPKKSKHFCPSPDLFDDCSPSPKKQISTTPCTKEKLDSQENFNIDAAYYFGHSETPCMSRKIPPKPGPSKSGFLDENFATPGISAVPQISSSPVLSLRDRTLRTQKTTQESTSSKSNYYINNSELSPQKSSQNSQIISEDSQSPVLSARDCTLIRRKMAKKRILNEEKTICAVQKSTNQNLQNLEKNSQDPVGHDAAPVDVSMDLNDICDLDTFGLRRDKNSSAPEKFEHRQKTKLPYHHHQQAGEGESFRNTTPLEELDISDICNLTAFGISNQSNKQKSLELGIKSLVEKSPTKLAGVPASLDVTDICDISGLLGTFSTSQNNPSLKISDNCPRGRSFVEKLSSFSQKSPGKIRPGSLQKSPAKPLNKFDLFPVTSESPESVKLKVSQDCSPNLTELSKIDTSPVPKKSKDFDPNSPETKNARKSKFDSCQERNDNVSLTDLSDFCDISNLMPTTDGNIRMTYEQNCQSNAVIDLTDSADSSPIKARFTQEKIQNATPQTLLSKYFDSSFTSKPSTSKSLLQLRKTGNKATSTCTGPSSAIKNSPKNPRAGKQSSKSTPERSQKQSNSSFSLLDSTNSDEDFEEKTPIVVKIPRKNQRKNSQTSSSQCQRKIQFSSSTSSSTSSPSQIPRNNPKRNVASATTNITENSKKITKKLPRKNVFIDDEAVLSEDENVNVSQDETLGNSDDSDLDRYEMSFVANDDDTECFLPNTQVHADYMKSVRSPVLHRGKFKIPQRPVHNVTNVYSQPEITTNMDNTYLDDTFCVTNDNEDDSGSDETNKDGGGTSKHELSELEILEQKLEEMRKNKRKNKETSTGVKNNDNSKKNKRRRIIVSDDDDSD